MRDRVRRGVEALSIELVHGGAIFPPHPGPLPWGEGESPAAAWRIERAGSCGRDARANQDATSKRVQKQGCAVVLAAAFCALDIAAAAAKTRSAWREWFSKTFPKLL